jgi:hypothetical protein
VQLAVGCTQLPLTLENCLPLDVLATYPDQFWLAAC